MPQHRLRDSHTLQVHQVGKVARKVREIAALDVQRLHFGKMPEDGRIKRGVGPVAEDNMGRLAVAQRARPQRARQSRVALQRKVAPHASRVPRLDRFRAVPAAKHHLLHRIDGGRVPLATQNGRRARQTESRAKHQIIL